MSPLVLEIAASDPRSFGSPSSDSRLMYCQTVPETVIQQIHTLVHVNHPGK